jgi:hypothetical protein
MKKTSLFPYGNSRADNSGRRREESGRKSREGTRYHRVVRTFVTKGHTLSLQLTMTISQACYVYDRPLIRLAQGQLGLDTVYVHVDI